MLALSYYLLKVIICSGILLGYYWLALRNKVFHAYNRFYLLAAVVLSLLLPIVKINFWEKTVAEKPSVIKMLQAVSDNDVYVDTVILSNQPQPWGAEQWATIVYFIITLIFLIVLFQTLFVIYRLLKKYPRQKIDNITFVNTNAKSTPFSFLNYIFWNQNIDSSSATGKQIFKHELAHIQQKHTHDKLFINAVLVFFWCNPFFWLLRKELSMIHEFIADRKAVEDYDTAAFAVMILQATYPQHQFALTNNFFYSPIKRRLAMLVKNKNPKVSYLSRLMVLPIAVIVFAAFTFKTKGHATAPEIDEKVTVFIDASHGGNDFGASSLKGDVEKNLSLEIAKKIKELNTNSKIEIILSRESDIFLTPLQRAEAAAKQNADMLISIHINSNPKHVTKSGVEFFVANNQYANSVQSKVLASILIETFNSNYKLPVIAQPKQMANNIVILQKNTFPSVIIEAGYINTEADINYLRTNEAKETIAKNILTAISKFSSANAQANTRETDLFTNDNKDNIFLVNVKHSDTNYLKSDDYKKKALVFIDDKEVGNLGMNYIEKRNIKFNSIAIYRPDEAIKTYGDKGKYGAIRITQNSIAINTLDGHNDNKKITELIIEGKSSKLNGEISNAIIYLDGKEITKEQLNKIDPKTIENVSLMKGDKLGDILDTKGKTSVIQITLKPTIMEEVIVTNKKANPLVIVDGKEQSGMLNESVSPNEIESVNVLKGESATVLYGEKGKNGVIEVTTKRNLPDVLYVVDGEIKEKDIVNTLSPERIQSIDVLKGESAIVLYGEKGKNGVIKITTKKLVGKVEEVVVTGYPAKKAVTKTGEIYIGAENKIILPTDKDKYDVMVNINNGSVNATDNHYIATVNPTGLLRVTIFKKGTNHVLHNINFKATRLPDNIKNVPTIKLDDYIRQEVIL